MKKLYHLIILAALFTFAVQSCKKSSSTPASTGSSISFTYNGTAYSFTSITAKYEKSQGLMQIAAHNSPATIYIALTDSGKTGTFSLDNGQDISVGPDANSQHGCMLDQGTISVSSFTGTTVAGTFNGTGTDLGGNVGTLTNGKFQVTYTEQ